MDEETEAQRSAQQVPQGSQLVSDGGMVLIPGQGAWLRSLLS